MNIILCDSYKTKNIYISLTICIHSYGTNLQTNRTRRSRETSGALIPLLSKHALLSSGTRLSITSLINNKQKQRFEQRCCDLLLRFNFSFFVSTYSRTRSAYRTLETSWTRRTLKHTVKIMPPKCTSPQSQRKIQAPTNHFLSRSLTGYFLF